MKLKVLHKVCMVAMISACLSSPANAKSWWGIAGADGGGAMTGGGATAVTLNVVSATPPGWVAIGAGAIFGGACASLAYAGSISNPTGDGGWNGSWPLEDDINYAAMKDVSVGNLHNQLVQKYRRNHGAYDQKTFKRFALAEIKKFTEVTGNKFDRNQAERSLSYWIQHGEKTAKRLDNASTDDVVKLWLERLPRNIDSQRFTREFKSVMSSPSPDESTYLKLRALEKWILTNLGENFPLKKELSDSFSIFANSAAYWQVVELSNGLGCWENPPTCLQTLPFNPRPTELTPFPFAQDPSILNCPENTVAQRDGTCLANENYLVKVTNTYTAFSSVK